MTVLGIDPGTRRIGYGIVQKKGNDVDFVAAGILEIIGADDISALREVKVGIDALIKKYKPDIFSIEKLYFAKNQTTALAVAQARGVIILSACERGIPIQEFSPNEIKLGIAGYGFADKKAMLKMVKLILHKDDLKVIDDASDALAIAIMGTNKITNN
jgi:crossover junction endodeoxyribonuclease RuvC